MLLPKAPSARQSDIAKANCAGQGCEDRGSCRRYQVNIGDEWRVSTGQWASFDVERAMTGECKSFVRWIGNRRAA